MIKKKKNYLLSISQFAKLSKLSVSTLVYYDRTGILSPIHISENGYRYYHIEQAVAVNLIRTFQAFGIQLDEIKRIKDSLTPQIACELFELHISKFDEKIEELVRIQNLLRSFQQSIQNAMNVDEETITIQELPAKAIVIGDLNDYSKGRTLFDALYDFHISMEKKLHSVDMHHAIRGIYTQEQIKRKQWHLPERFYFNNPAGRDRRPGGLYAVGYSRGNYGEVDDIYDRMLDFISKNGYEICGDAYKEYPHNELCTPSKEKYLIRILINVRKKSEKQKGKKAKKSKAVSSE